MSAYTQDPTRPRPGPKPKYPWDQWFGKKTFTVVKGTHYTTHTHTMAQVVRNAAADRGVRVSIKMAPNLSWLKVTVRHDQS